MCIRDSTKGKGDTNIPKRKSYYKTFISNLLNAVAYYQGLYEKSLIADKRFPHELSFAMAEIENISETYQLK